MERGRAAIRDKDSSTSRDSGHEIRPRAPIRDIGWRKSPLVDDSPAGPETANWGNATGDGRVSKSFRIASSIATFVASMSSHILAFSSRVNDSGEPRHTSARKNAISLSSQSWLTWSWVSIAFSFHVVNSFDSCSDLFSDGMRTGKLRVVLSFRGTPPLSVLHTKSYHAR